MASNNVLTSTPNKQNGSFISGNRFQALAGWSECEQTPVGRRQNETAKRPAPSVSSSVFSVSESLLSFSTMPTDSKLNMIFQRVEMLGKNEERFD